MEVVLNIPDDLVKYIEYIPGDTLPELIIDILRQDILSRHAKQNERSKQMDTSLSEILSMLSNLQTKGVTVQQASSNTIQSAITGHNSVVVEDTQTAEIVQVESMTLDFEDEELGDLLDLMK